MRTIIDLKKNQLEELSQICTRENISRSEAIRQAIDWFSKMKLPSDSTSVFGLWKDQTADSLEIEDQLRKEWE